jgi:DNA primase
VRYTDESKERVREAVDFASLVGERVELRRAGVNRMVGLCPFHDERTPSFGIDPVKKVFHCFGCGEGGDVFKWAELVEGLDFTAALESLADRFGVQLERESEDPEDAARRERRERLLEALERTATFYVRFLWESDEARPAREYLLGRGLEEGVLREFRVGYAPSKWDTVLMASQRAGFKPRELYDAGLVQRSGGEGRIYDRFRSRIMFPLADARGRVLGFGARSMGEGRGPKYLNTAENELFHKGRMVYAADLARAAAARAGSVVLCEGYTDVIALHQAGLRNAVATMGTALTGEQVGELAKLAPVVHMALDADAAGQKAMLRAAEVAKGRSIELRVVPLPAGLDPADLVARDGADAMRALVERSVRFEEFRVDAALAAGDLSSAEGKDRVLADVRPVFAALGPSVLRDDLLRKLADRLDVTPELVASLLPRAARGAGSSGVGPPVAPAPAEAPSDPVKRRGANERLFLARCLALPERGRAALGEIDPEDFATDLNRRAAAWLRDHLDDPLTGLPPGDDELRDLLVKLQARSISDPAREAALETDLRRLQIEWLERRMASGTGPRAVLAAERAKRQAQLHEVAGEAL